MRKIQLALFFIAALLISGISSAAEKKLTVVATIFPLYDFAREIGRDRVEATKLIPPGIEAHAFELKGQDMARIDNADVFIYTGKYMEPWVEDLLKGIDNRRLTVVDASRGIELMDIADRENAASGENGEVQKRDGRRGLEGKDPHIWLDLSNAQKMAQEIAETFARKDPEGKEYYLANAAKYNAKLVDLDGRFKAALSTCNIRTIVYAGHFTFGYFAKRYALTHVSPYHGYSPNAEPSPKDIKEMIEAIKKTGAKYIYYEELIDPKVARVISAETGCGLILLHGAHNVSKDDMSRGVTFLSIMEDDLVKLKEGLECR